MRRDNVGRYGDAFFVGPEEHFAIILTGVFRGIIYGSCVAFAFGGDTWDMGLSGSLGPHVVGKTLDQESSANRRETALQLGYSTPENLPQISPRLMRNEAKCGGLMMTDEDSRS
jgi:hypothetical protein